MQDNQEMKDGKIEIDWIKVIMQEIEDKTFKRSQVAHTYRIIIWRKFPVDWKAINEAIIKRWSRSGLEYIKNLAWRKQKAVGFQVSNEPIAKGGNTMKHINSVEIFSPQRIKISLRNDERG